MSSRASQAWPSASSTAVMIMSSGIDPRVPQSGATHRDDGDLVGDSLAAHQFSSPDARATADL